MNDLTPEQEEQAQALLKRIFCPSGGFLYTFHRAEGFYPLELPDDETAKANAFCNPGTIRVVNEVTRQTVWETEMPATGEVR